MAVTAEPARHVPPHGTRQRYQLRRAGCRCAACRAANTRYMRRWRNGPPTSSDYPDTPLWRGAP